MKTFLDKRTFMSMVRQIQWEEGEDRNVLLRYLRLAANEEASPDITYDNLVQSLDEILRISSTKDLDAYELKADTSADPYSTPSVLFTIDEVYSLIRTGEAIDFGEEVEGEY